MSQDELDREIKSILSKYRTVAVVGLSRDPSKDSRAVASYLKSEGYQIIPVNPFCEEVLGKKCYKSLLETPEELVKSIDIIDIFRRSPDVPPIVEQAIQLRKKYGKPEVIWMQLGILNEEAAKTARDAGMVVIMDRCVKIEHARIKRRATTL
jgi:predicted CoA-binding protein